VRDQPAKEYVTKLVSEDLFEAAVGNRPSIDHERKKGLINKSVATALP
jgi:hypothetical protein